MKKLKYLIITGLILMGVALHFVLTALLFSDAQSGAAMAPESRARAVRAKRKVARTTPRKSQRFIAKRKITSGKITGTVRGRGAMGAPMIGNPVAAKILAGARRKLGTPYVWGGTDPKKGFDCSGFTQYVYREAGIVIPRVAREQFDALRGAKEPMPGDLVFFAMDGNDINHVGIYMGKGLFVHAPKKGDVVKYSNLNKMFWRTRYLGAGAAF